MKLTQDELIAMNIIVKPVLGHKAQNVNLGIGSFVTIEFGRSPIDSQKKGLREWYLWIYCCGWYLENPNGQFIGSEDPRDSLKQEIKALEGHTLENIVISPVGLETDFLFENGLVLHTFPLNFIEPCDYWKLFTPDGKVLTIGSNKVWSYVSSSKPRLP